MPTDAIAVPRLKEFKFRLEVNGFPAAMVEEFDPGARTIAVVESAGAGQNFPIKEAGMMKFDHAVCRNVVPTDGAGKTFWEKQMNLAQDPSTGNGSAPGVYWFNFTMYELDNSGNPVRAWEFFQAFVSSYKLGNRSAMTQDKNVIEEVELAYSSRIQRSITSG